MPPKPSETENNLLRQLHRAEHEPLARAFGDTYAEPDADELEVLQAQWLPLIRTHVARELGLAHQREAALRAALEAALGGSGAS